MAQTTTNAKAAASTKSVARLLAFEDVLDELREAAEDAWLARTEGRPRGPGTGLKSLDGLLGDALQPGVHVVNGGPGTGKTAFGLQAGATCGFPALFVSCEMSLVELLRRHTARVTHTPLEDLKSGALEPDAVYALAKRAVAAAPRLGVVDATRAHVPPEDLLAFGRTVRGADRHVLVVVDSVHSWAAGDDQATEYERLSAGLEDLQTVAAELACPVLAVAERNRASMDVGGLHASAGTRRFEYGAESVLGLSVATGKDVPLFPEKDKKPVKITVEKNRNGNHGVTLKAVFFGRYQEFLDGGW